MSVQSRTAAVLRLMWPDGRLLAPSSSGPISEIVARTGWPCSPSTSQNVTGQPEQGKSFSRNLWMRSAILGFSVPG